MKKIVAISFIFWNISLSAQNTIEIILDSVKKNNRSIIAEKKALESMQAYYKTGLTPDDPMVGLDYMKGTPADAGNQIDFTVTQAFDFPSVYSKRKEIAGNYSDLGEQNIIRVRRDVLLDAKQTCLLLIKLNKQKSILENRIIHAEKLSNDFERKLNAGECGILETNKSKLNVLNLKNDFNLNESKRKQMVKHLAELNGGKEIIFSDTIFSGIITLPVFEELESAAEKADPDLISLEEKLKITDKEIALQKALWYPKLETGYHYQAILGQTFNGVHIGFSIPLWQNKNKVLQKTIESEYVSSLIDEHRVSHRMEMEELYEKYLIIGASLLEYKETARLLSPIPFLEKAFAAGEISTVEYFLELTSYYSIEDRITEMEWEYFSVIAELEKYLL